MRKLVAFIVLMSLVGTLMSAMATTGDDALYNAAMEAGEAQEWISYADGQHVYRSDNTQWMCGRYCEQLTY